MATAPKFRIDVDIHHVLTNSSPGPTQKPAVKSMKLPDPIFPRFPEKLLDPGPAVPPEKQLESGPSCIAQRAARCSRFSRPCYWLGRRPESPCVTAVVGGQVASVIV